MRFHLVDTLTGRLLDRIYPSAWELVDPLREPGTGSLTAPIPPDPGSVGSLVEFTQPRRHWVAVEDDDSRLVWGGPIPRRPARDGGNVVIPLIDWRGWFYRTPIRPVDDDTRRTYIARDRRQDLIWADLVDLALDTIGSPRIAVDTPPDAEVTRDRTAQMLDRSIGEYLDTLVETERGIEWWTYIARDPADPLALVPHVTMAYPERTQRAAPLRVQWVAGRGGNIASYDWPESGEGFTRVWGIGDGQPPDQAWAVAEDPDLTDGPEIAWESVVGPLDGVVRSATAFEHAFEELQRSQGRQGLATITVAAEQVPYGDVMPGDRARVILRDEWEDVDLPAVRIVSVRRTGGRGQPKVSELTLDLADATAPAGDEPGEAVSG